MTATTGETSPKSLVMHSAARHYDLLAWVLTLGRDRALRERFVEIAGLAPGETVLDVGCGTGALAVVAARRVGPTGRVHGVDASPEMIAQARAKAEKAGVDVAFDVARAESLPVADASVDVVLSTLMLHHLPAVVRERFVGEIRRVLKPGGRVLAVDFEPPAQKRGGLISRMHRHGHVPLREIVALLERAGLRLDEQGAVRASDLQFALAHRPAPNVAAPSSPPTPRALPPLPMPRWVWVAGIAIVLSMPVLLVRFASAGIVLGALSAVVVVALLAHVGAVEGVHRLLVHHKRRR